MRTSIAILGCVTLFACGKEASPSSDAASTATATSSDGCPKDISADQVGKSCKTEGLSCSPSGSSPRAIYCQHGKWTELAISPPPQLPSSAK